MITDQYIPDFWWIREKVTVAVNEHSEHKAQLCCSQLTSNG
jgi:hypothetical protein